jgi:hypothetical protein
VIEELRGIGLIVLAVVAAWLIFRVVKKIVLAVIVVLLVGALALFIYVRFL